MYTGEPPAIVTTDGEAGYLWIRTDHLPTRLKVLGGAIVGAIVMAGTFVAFLGYGSGAPLIVLVGIALEASVLWSAQATRRIGVNANGLRVDRYWGSLVFPWEALRPGDRPPSGGWATLALEGEEIGRRTFWVTRGQAAAILDQPECPRERFGAEFVRWAYEGEVPGAG